MCSDIFWSGNKMYHKRTLDLLYICLSLVTPVLLLCVIWLAWKLRVLNLFLSAATLWWCCNSAAAAVPSTTSASLVSMSLCHSPSALPRRCTISSFCDSVPSSLMACHAFVARLEICTHKVTHYQNKACEGSLVKKGLARDRLRNNGQYCFAVIWKFT